MNKTNIEKEFIDFIHKSLEKKDYSFDRGLFIKKLKQNKKLALDSLFDILKNFNGISEKTFYKERTRIYDGLAQIADKSNINLIMKFLVDEPNKNQSYFFKELANKWGENVLPYFIEYITSNVELVGMNEIIIAFGDFGRNANESDFEKIKNFLISELKNSNYLVVKYSLASIIKLKIKEAIPEIIALGASNKNFQYEATLALGELGYDKVLGDLITRAQQRDDNALIILGNYGLKARKAVPIIIYRLHNLVFSNGNEKDNFPKIIRSFARIDHKACINELLELIIKPRYHFPVADMLIELQAVEAIPKLFDFLKQHGLDNFGIIKALGGLKATEALETLLELTANCYETRLKAMLMRTLVHYKSPKTLQQMIDFILTAEVEEGRFGIEDNINYQTKLIIFDSIVEMAETEIDAKKALFMIVKSENIEFSAKATEKIIELYTQTKDKALLVLINENVNSLKSSSPFENFYYNLSEEQDQTKEVKEQIKKSIKEIEENIDLSEFQVILPKIQELLKLSPIKAVTILFKFLEALQVMEIHSGGIHTIILNELKKVKIKAERILPALLKELRRCRYDDNDVITGYVISEYAIPILETIEAIKAEIEAIPSLIEMLSWINNRIMYEYDRGVAKKWGNDSGHAKVGLKIISIMVKTKDSRCVPVLIETVGGSLSVLEEQALIALGEIGNEDAIVAIIRIAWNLMIQNYRWHDINNHDQYYVNYEYPQLQNKAQEILQNLNNKINEIIIQKLIITICEYGDNSNYSEDIEDYLIENLYKYYNDKMEIIAKAIVTVRKGPYKDLANYLFEEMKLEKFLPKKLKNSIVDIPLEQELESKNAFTINALIKNIKKYENTDYHSQEIEKLIEMLGNVNTREAFDQLKQFYIERKLPKGLDNHLLKAIAQITIKEKNDFLFEQLKKAKNDYNIRYFVWFYKKIPITTEILNEFLKILEKTTNRDMIYDILEIIAKEEIQIESLLSILLKKYTIIKDSRIFKEMLSTVSPEKLKEEKKSFVKDSNDSHTSLIILEKLEESITEEDYPFLKEIFEKNKDGRIRHRALIYMGNLNTNKALPFLNKIIQTDHSISTQILALKYITESNDEIDNYLTNKILDNNIYRENRNSFISAFIRLNPSKAKRLLKQIIKENNDSYLVNKAKEILEKTKQEKKK